MPKERSSRLHAYTDVSGEPQALPLVRGFFADPNCGWSVGAYGAIAEFMRAKDDAAELTDTDEGGALVTDRGALRVRLREGVRMALSEQICWNRGVAFRSLRGCKIPSAISTVRPR